MGTSWSWVRQGSSRVGLKAREGERETKGERGGKWNEDETGSKRDS